MQPKIHVSLSIVDEALDPDEVTGSTGIIPTRVWRKGDIRPKTTMKEEENGWELCSALSPSAPLVEHLSHLLAAIHPGVGQLQAFTRQYYAVLSCAVYFNESSPEIHFETSVIQQLAGLNLRLDVDIYCLD